MIDPIDSLAFSIQSNRGVYALLLGSGVSKAAEIPTGWEITLDLIRKLAAVSRQTAGSHPEDWFREQYGESSDYSKLLEGLARTQAERQRLLRSYFEANEQEREEGEKQPTAAHRAIAKLVAQGFIKVIITTNFDCLMEQALESVGFTPAVLSTPEQLQGMQPLIHNRCLVFKIHGDYRDTRILNTLVELSEYPKDFDDLLDQILKDFGLIVCGWSAIWDTALRSAILRCSSRRYTTYWANIGDPSDEARKLINHRDAQVIDINDADSFFSRVQERVQSLEEFSRPHPLSTEAAVASLKRFLPEARHRIRLNDLVDSVVDHVVETVSTPAFDTRGVPSPNKELVTARVRAYDSACTTLLAMASIGGYHAEEYHRYVWENALQRLSLMPHADGTTLWLDLQKYPATLLLYSLGLGAVSSGRLQLLGNIFATEINQQYDEVQPAVKMLSTIFLTAAREHLERLLEGMDRSYIPLSEWMRSVLRQHTRRIIPNDKQYDVVFDKLEILKALSYLHHDNYRGWVPYGRFAYANDVRMPIFQEIRESIAKFGNESPFVKYNICGETTEACTKALVALERSIQQPGWYG